MPQPVQPVQQEQQIKPFYFTPTNQWPWSTGGTVITDSGTFRVDPYTGSSRKVSWEVAPAQNVSPFASFKRWVVPQGTKDNAAVLQGWTYTGTLPQAQEWWLPAPTVATPQKPVIMRTKGAEKVGYQPTDYSDVEAMDLVQLRDFSRSLQYDQSQGKTLTKEQMLKLQRAQDRAIELSAPQSQVTTTALDTLVSDKEKAKSVAQTQLEAQNQAQLQSQQQFEQQRLAAIQAQNAKAEEKQRNTLGYILWAQWAATSSYGAEALNEITGYFNQQNQLAIAESYANLEKFKAEQAGATREQLAKYDDQIFQLQAAKAKYVTEAAMKVDEYNQQQAQGTEKSLQNILDVAMAQEAAQVPLTDAEKEQVKAYWQLLIDEKGWINKEMLDIVPPKLRNQALINAAAVKWALPKEPKTLNTDGGAYVYDYATQTRKKLAWSEGEKDDKRTQLDDWTLLNTRTGETRNITSEWTIQSAIQKAIEKCWDAAQCGRFVNEVGKQAWVNLWIGNSYASKEAAINKIWQAMNANEMGAWSIFAYPTNVEIMINWEKVRPWHIGIVTSVNTDGTINIMDYNYNKDEKRRERMNVNPQEIFSKGWLISKPIITNETVPQGTKPLTDKQFTQSNQVITSFKSDPQVKAFEEAYSNSLNLLSSLNDATWPWDVSAIFQFMKTLDPQSVVRESEFETAAKSAWVFQYIGNTYDRLTKWEKLTDTQRKAFGELSKQFIRNRASVYNTKYEDWIRRLEKQGIDTGVFPTNIANEIEKYLWWQSQTNNESQTQWTTLDDLAKEFNIQ